MDETCDLKECSRPYYMDVVVELTFAFDQLTRKVGLCYEHYQMVSRGSVEHLSLDNDKE